VLRPERDVKLNAAPLDGNLNPPRHDVLLPDTIEDDVDGANEDLPDAVEAEEVTENVEVFSLECR
jgi:hypothetical protein